MEERQLFQSNLGCIRVQALKKPTISVSVPRRWLIGQGNEHLLDSRRRYRFQGMGSSAQQLVEIQVSDLNGVAPASSHYFLQRYASQSKQDFDHDN
jgi:hypothetical protein